MCEKLKIERLMKSCTLTSKMLIAFVAARISSQSKRKRIIASV